MSHPTKIAVVGATGTMGKPIVDELLRVGKHEVTALSRPESKATFPPGVSVARASYDDHAALVSALRGQHVLIITMSVHAAKDSQAKLIDAAAEAEVPYVLPNIWGGDTEQRAMFDVWLGDQYLAAKEHIERLGKSAWIGITCGFWYEFSLAGTIRAYGFDFENRKVRFYDKGTARLNTSTWEQVGRAVAGLLSLPESRDDSDGNGPSLSDYTNKFVYVSSFFISQKDMFESVLRVTNTKESDWNITYEKSADCFKSGMELLQTGNRAGFTQALYSRSFFPEGSEGDTAMAFEKTHKLINEALDLPKEHLDEHTRVAVKMAGDLLNGSYGHLKN